MTAPPPKKPEDQRRSTSEKILIVMDVMVEVVLAVLRIFGRRKNDQKY
jgi:hypothetical protein